MVHTRSWPREASYFSLMKSNQKSSQQKCFFARGAFALQTSQNHGLLNLTSTSFAHSSASVRFANAPAIAQAIIFCLLSPEAVLLTEEEIIGIFFRNPLSAAGEERVIQRSADRVSRLRQFQHFANNPPPPSMYIYQLSSAFYI